jgi:hypothetical protein
MTTTSGTPTKTYREKLTAAEPLAEFYARLREARAA